MPTVIRDAAYRFHFDTHAPTGPGRIPHVHVERDGRSAKFRLDPVALARNHGFEAEELLALARLVQHRRGQLIEAWNQRVAS